MYQFLLFYTGFFKIDILLWCSLGVIISVILPIIRAYIPTPPLSPNFWAIAKPYIFLGLFSLIVSILLIAYAGNALTDPREALLLGYAWDSTVQKIGKTP